MSGTTNGPGGETVVGRPGWEAVLVWVGFPVLGALLGLGVRPLADWVLDTSWVPDFAPFRFVAELPQPGGTIGTVAAGVVLGVVVALTAEGEVLRVGVGPSAVTLTRDGTSRTIARGDVTAVFADGKELVLVSRSGLELAREKSDLAPARLAAAFSEQGYPWRPDGDPHRDQYRRWVPDEPELPAGANAVLKARAGALEKGDQKDLAELRDEAAKLGVVVRDQDKRQYWRRAKIGG
ncbi:YqeB family protein [Jiangella alkaliphila]|uniref:DUF308 domain-containing protein n=1 Tax=Jiangella alkaliphila TaxID=419479 RepID=A0A1H2KSK6_9ACTN|nr:hypothetical protein [Jiangella alkaliphila]SDU71632.1 hypothetical protein SAMN04488563_4216 [Jiangella alkaliphila]